MSKARGVEARLARVRELRQDAPGAALELKKALADRSNLVVAEAAAIVEEAGLAELASDLAAAFDRLMIDPAESDKLCLGKTAIVKALDKIEYAAAAPFLRGIHHVQMEPVWGGSEDSAASLRGHCAFALVRLNHRDILLLLADLLADEAQAARLAAAQALGASGLVAAIPLLRFKVRLGDDEPAVIGACFSALIALDPAESIPFVARFLGGIAAGLADSPARLEGEALDPSIVADEPIQEAAAFALGESRRPAALAPLKSFCDRTETGPLQEAAFLALAMLRLPAAIDFLVDVVGQGEQSRAMAALAGLAIHRHSPGVQERTLAAVEKNGNAALRTRYEKKFAK